MVRKLRRDRRGRFARKPGLKPLHWKRSRADKELSHVRAKSFIARRFDGDFAVNPISKDDWEAAKDDITNELTEQLSPKFRRYWARHRERGAEEKRGRYSRLAEGKFHRPEYYIAHFAFKLNFGEQEIINKRGEEIEAFYAWSNLDLGGNESFKLREYIRQALDSVFAKYKAKEIELEECYWNWYRPGAKLPGM